MACINSTSPLITFTGSGGTAPFTFTYKINGGSNQTISTVTGSSVTLGVPTATVETYTYSLVSVKDGSPNACTQPQLGSATITVLPDATIFRTSALATISQSVCINTAINSITYSIGGGATSATFTGLPAGITTTVSGNTVTISGTPVAPGTFSYTVQTTGTCIQASATGTIIVNATPIGGITTSSNNLFVCAGVNAGTVSLSGHTGSVSKWQSSINGGLTWTDISSTSTSIAYSSLNQTTWYRAVIIQPTCPGLLTYSAHTVVNVVPITASISGFASPAVICSGSSTLTASASGSSSTVGVIEGGSFDQAGSPLEGAGLWRATERGSHHNIEGSANNGTNPFNLTNGPKEFFGPPSYAPNPYTVTYNNNPLGGEVNNNKFMVANGLVDCTLETPIFNLIGLSRASIDWWEAYILQPGATIKMEISTDGGNTYNTFLRPHIVGPVSYASPTDFAKTSVDLSAYAGLSNLRVRFTYTSTTYSSWGLEMATITKGITTPAYTWNLYEPAPVTGTPPAHYLNEFVNNSVTVTPPSPNNTNAPITYYYSLASSEGGCASNVTVTVNPTPRITHSPVGPVCSGVPLSPNITFSSTIPGTTYTYSIINPAGVTGLVTNANGTISGIPVNPTTVSQTIRFIATGITPYCPGIPDTVDLVVNPTRTIAISGNQTICGNGSAIITLTSSGPFPFSATLSNGITYQLNSSPFNITVNPTVNTTYTITSLIGACISNGGTTGSATVNVVSNAGITGTWLCTAGDGDWFNPCNWANLIVPDTSINVIIATISSTCDPVIDPLSPFAPIYGPIAESKNITISGTRNLSFANSGELHVAGNWLNNVGPAGFTANTGTVSMIGSVFQTITTTAGSTEAFYNLTINNSSSVTAGVTLYSNITVSNTLTLIDGIVNTRSNPPVSPTSAAANAFGLLTMTTTANPVAGSPGINSFVNGQMARQFNTSGVASEYAYPIGKVISGVPIYRDMAVQPTTTSAITTFTSEYFPTPHPAPSVMLGTGLIGIVREYWQVDQSGGTADAKIKIPYFNPGAGNWIGNNNEPTSDPCNACNVAVVRKDISMNGWNFTANAGNFSSTGPEFRYYQDNGYIYSATNSSFGPFTNGYAFNVILAVQLINFDAKLENGDGKISWTIADSKDLDVFELQQSVDGQAFSRLATVPGRTGLTQYKYQHPLLSAGPHFYRLRVKEKTGKNFYSKTVLINVGKEMTMIVGLQPTVVQSETFVKIHSVKSQTVHAELLDMAGRKMAIYKGNLLHGENRFAISARLLAKGMYTLQVQTEDGVHANLRFMKE